MLIYPTPPFAFIMTIINMIIAAARTAMAIPTNLFTYVIPNSMVSIIITLTSICQP